MKRLFLGGAACLIILLGVMSDQPIPPTATLALLGDVMLGRGVDQAHSDGSWEDAFSVIGPILADSDLTLANLESPFGDAPKRAMEHPDLNLTAPPEAVSALVTGGFDLLSLSNNHNLDAGRNGIDITSKILRGAGMQEMGPELQPLIRSVNGIRLGFFALDDISQPVDVNAACEAIRRVASSGAVVVVSIHWGREYEPAANSRQRALAQQFADAGADLVWGHHPHVLQSLEWVDRNGSDIPALVAFSLGNALFDQITPPEARRSAVLFVTLDRQGILSVHVQPVEIDPRNGRVDLPGEDAQKWIFDRLGMNRQAGKDSFTSSASAEE